MGAPSMCATPPVMLSVHWPMCMRLHWLARPEPEGNQQWAKQETVFLQSCSQTLHPRSPQLDTQQPPNARSCNTPAFGASHGAAARGPCPPACEGPCPDCRSLLIRNCTRILSGLHSSGKGPRRRQMLAALCKTGGCAGAAHRRCAGGETRLRQPFSGRPAAGSAAAPSAASHVASHQRQRPLAAASSSVLDDDSLSIADLEAQLRSALAVEDYTLAAGLRDAIQWVPPCLRA